MGRLFWKFFISIGMAQLVIALIVGIIFSIYHQREISSKEIDISPHAAFHVNAAAATLQHGGKDALLDLLEEKELFPVYVIDETGQELLGREAPSVAFSFFHDRTMRLMHQEVIRQVRMPDGHTYVLFSPAFVRKPGEKATASPLPPPPPPRPHFIPMEPLFPTIAVSLVFAAFLAWHFSRRIHLLRQAFEAVSMGDMQVQLDFKAGRWRDELSDLGRDFNTMVNRLRALMDGQKRLLHHVSHELRSPLARLSAAVGLLRQEPQKIETAMARMEQECLRIDRLVGELLDLSRLEAGTVDTSAEVVDIDELLADMHEDARFEAKAEGKQILLHAGSHAMVRGKADLLERAVGNIIRNAIRHSADGSDIAVSAMMDTATGWVRLSVTDQGEGVPEEELNTIFEPFFRSKQTGLTADGYGLGLAIARQIILAHHGIIRAFNFPEKGLCVEMLLPVEANNRHIPS